MPSNGFRLDACSVAPVVAAHVLVRAQVEPPAKYCQPPCVRIYVVSVTQAWLGPLGSTRRASRLSEAGSA